MSISFYVADRVIRKRWYDIDVENCVEFNIDKFQDFRNSPFYLAWMFAYTSETVLLPCSISVSPVCMNSQCTQTEIPGVSTYYSNRKVFKRIYRYSCVDVCVCWNRDAPSEAPFSSSPRE